MCVGSCAHLMGVGREQGRDVVPGPPSAGKQVSRTQQVLRRLGKSQGDTEWSRRSSLEAPMGPGGDFQSLGPTACGPQCGHCVHQLLSLSQFRGRSPCMLSPHRGGALTAGHTLPSSSQRQAETRTPCISGDNGVGVKEG